MVITYVAFIYSNKIIFISINSDDKMFNDDTEETDEDTILDRRTFIHNSNKTLTTSGPLLLGLNQYNVGVYHDSSKLSQKKTIILAVTCTAIGMLTGLLGPTFPLLAENISTELSSIIQLVTVKAIGFLLGTCLSSYLYTWFNVCCLLGLSCLSISFGVCSLAFITDLTAFYLTSLILGLGLGLSYNGIDALYNRLWARPSVSSIRWLHLLVAVGAILSTLLLLPSTFATDEDISSTTHIVQSPRLRRAISNETTLPYNLSSTTLQFIKKPAVVHSDLLSGSLYTKPSAHTNRSTTKPLCSRAYCCYDENNRNSTFICHEQQQKNQSDDCKTVLSSCRASPSNLCHINQTAIWCRIDRNCANETTSNCSVQSIEAVFNATRSTKIIISSTRSTELIVTSSTKRTTSITTTTSSSTSRAKTTKIRMPVISHTKPSTADSDNDDLSQNFLYTKIRSFLQSITSIDILYLFLTCVFFLLGIIYSILAMRGEGVNSSSTSDFSPLSLLLLKSHQITSNSNTQVSLLSNSSSLKFVILIILFYLILSGIESSCIYLTYSFGIKLNLSESKSILLQFSYLLGRFMDLFITYLWFLLDKYRKKQSAIISLKCLVLLRLIVLFAIGLCNLFQPITYFFFFSMGFFLTSLSSSILSWIERDFFSNELFLRIILFTIIMGEIIFPICLIDKAESFTHFYSLIGIALLVSLFVMILYTSRQLQGNRMYRLLPESMDMEEMESQENTDNDRYKDTKLH